MFVASNYHFAPGKRADLYAGVWGGFSYYDDIIFSFPGEDFDEILRFDDDLGFGVKLGVDVPFKRNSRWIFTSEARYLTTILEGEIAGQDLDVDPLMLSLGVGYRF